ncbi:MAG: hypothetical protein ACRCV7_06775 [Culicoidibacterales bacterium]
MSKEYPTYIIVLFVILLCLFIYRLGMSELTSMELILYTAIVLFIVFSRKKE